MHDSGNSSYGESKKTATMTFRLDENVLRILRSESKHNQITLNSLVNQLLKRYVEWDMFEPKVGMIPIAKPIVIQLFSKMTKEDISNMATEIGKDVVHDIALFMKNRMDWNPSFRGSKQGCLALLLKLIILFRMVTMFMF